MIVYITYCPCMHMYSDCMIWPYLGWGGVTLVVQNAHVVL